MDLGMRISMINSILQILRVIMHLIPLPKVLWETRKEAKSSLAVKLNKSKETKWIFPDYKESGNLSATLPHNIRDPIPLCDV